jgi:hypothetical protein
VAVDVQQRFHFLHLGGFLLADADQLAQHLGVKAGALGLQKYVLDIAAQRLALLLEPFDAFDDAAQAIDGDALCFGRLLEAV